MNEITISAILSIINLLNDNFSKLYNKYENELLKKLNISVSNDNIPYSPYEYYLNEHCASYSRILCNIFKEDSIKYYSEDHVITKIGNYYYDVAGLIYPQDIKNYHIVDEMGYHYINTCFNNSDYIEEQIEQELINIGLNHINEQKDKKIFTKSLPIYNK